MKLLLIADLHGALPDVHFKDFDAILAVGDFCYADDIRPLIMEVYQEYIDDPDNARMWWDLVSPEEATKLLDESLAAGRAILEKLDSFGVPAYVIPGNWDWTHVDEALAHEGGTNLYESVLLPGLKNIVDCEEALVDIGGVDIVGYGVCNGPELLEGRGYEDTHSEEELAENQEEFDEKLAEYDLLFESAKNPVILFSHNVPYGTAIDKIISPGNPRDGWHYGSQIARALIDKHKPLLCVSGHMHEYFGHTRVGDTTCINVGFGPEKNTLVTIEDGKVVSIEYVPEEDAQEYS